MYLFEMFNKHERLEAMSLNEALSTLGLLDIFEDALKKKEIPKIVYCLRSCEWLTKDIRIFLYNRGFAKEEINEYVPFSIAITEEEKKALIEKKNRDINYGLFRINPFLKIGFVERKRYEDTRFIVVKITKLNISFFFFLRFITWQYIYRITSLILPMGEKQKLDALGHNLCKVMQEMILSKVVYSNLKLFSK